MADKHYCSRRDELMTYAACQVHRANCQGVGNHCHGCDDYEEWDITQTPKPGPASPTKAQQLDETTQKPTRTDRHGICDECGEHMWLLGKGLCNACYRAKYPSTKPRKTLKKEAGRDVSSCEIVVDFGEDADLLDYLQTRAHKEYRTPGAVLLNILRIASGEARPGGDECPR